jgi:hypothetical protein
MVASPPGVRGRRKTLNSTMKKKGNERKRKTAESGKGIFWKISTKT